MRLEGGQGAKELDGTRLMVMNDWIVPCRGGGMNEECLEGDQRPSVIETMACLSLGPPCRLVYKLLPLSPYPQGAGKLYKAFHHKLSGVGASDGTALATREQSNAPQHASPAAKNTRQEGACCL